MKLIRGNIVDIFEDSIFYGELIIQEGRIFSIKKIGTERADEIYITPPFVDSHVHIESSMVVPAQFATAAIAHGTLASVSDPHEIANVLGLEGVEFMIQNGKDVPFYFCFGAPSCVPATTFETAGACLGLEEVQKLLEMPEIGYLAEMMNFPGVLEGNKEQLDKINLSHKLGKPVDGHAPGLGGEKAKAYFATGIQTDHECFTLEEAKEKLDLGVKILVREGSAAKNFDALIPLAKEYPHKMMFCSDDKHPDELLLWHINRLVSRAITSGVDYFDAIRMATLNPCRHYSLKMGLLREGDFADLVVWEDKLSFKAKRVYYKGRVVAEGEKVFFETPKVQAINKFLAAKHLKEDFKVPIVGDRVNVIRAMDGQLITEKIPMKPLMVDGFWESDVVQDCLKIVVVNRYNETKPSIGFIHGFGLKEGAIASSVAHDSHNIVAVGVDNQSLAEAINLIVRESGGVSIVTKDKKGVIPLPVAGLMSDKPAVEVAADYAQISSLCKNILGSKLEAPYMTLSFMALPVIPQLKITDKGIFDVDLFDFIDLDLKD